MTKLLGEKTLLLALSLILRKKMKKIIWSKIADRIFQIIAINISHDR
jgi:hypothetical protein